VTLAAPDGLTSAAPALQRQAPPAGLYIHIPFCVSHCPYCDFVVVAGREARGPANRIAALVDALEAELGLRADALDARWGPPGQRPALGSVYLGGGTPSLLPAASVARLLEIVRARFGVARDAEVTLEVNPGPDERGDAAAFRDAGVTRISIGAQSMDRAELGALGRRHSPADVAATLRAGRAAGIASISIDLLYDVPGGSLTAWARTLDAALALEPDHLSLYALTLDDPDIEGITGVGGDHLPVAPGARRWRERARAGQDDDRAAAMYELADARLARAGFAWYEISSWARPGHRSRHNLGYWQNRPWEAVGPGAHAFDGVTRRWNAARLDGYLNALRPGDGVPKLPPGGAVRIGGPAAMAELAILRLRTADGLAAADVDAEWLDGRLDESHRAGLVRIDGGRWVLTLRGRLLSNEVFTSLL
jgi:putative oxygen-independent coproporphyrinogen III oxidase